MLPPTRASRPAAPSMAPIAAVVVIVCVVLNQHTRTDLGTVFTTFVDNTGSGTNGMTWPGPIVAGIPLYVMLIGLLNAQYTLTGYDAGGTAFTATAFAGIRAGLEGYGPAHLVLLRFLVASVMLAGYAAWTRMR